MQTWIRVSERIKGSQNGRPARLSQVEIPGLKGGCSARRVRPLAFEEGAEQQDAGGGLSDFAGVNQTTRDTVRGSTEEEATKARKASGGNACLDRNL